MIVFSQENVVILVTIWLLSSILSCLQSEPDVVPQTDLVPTLALLLGVPIPYSNVGQILLPLFPSHGLTEGAVGGISQLEALWINAKQVLFSVQCCEACFLMSPHRNHSRLHISWSMTVILCIKFHLM